MERHHLNHGRNQPLGPFGVQNLSTAETEETPGDKNANLQNFEWCSPADHPQFHSQNKQAGFYYCIGNVEAPQPVWPPDHDAKELPPTLESYGMSQGQLPGVFSSMTLNPASGSFNQCVSGAPGVSSNCQIHTNGHESYQRPHQEAGSSSSTWEDNVHLDQYNATKNGSHDNVSLRELSEHQRKDMLVLRDVQQDPELGSASGSIEDTWEQYFCDNCGKQYRRPQELRRHTRDKHEQQRQCPFCHITWSRPEKIRAHLMTEHGDRFTEEENQQLVRLRGRRKTIHFIAKCGTSTPPT